METFIGFAAIGAVTVVAAVAAVPLAIPVGVGAFFFWLARD